MQITCIGIEGFCLSSDCLNHIRVRVAHMGNVVIDIEIFFSFYIIQPNIFAPNNMKWLRIKQAACISHVLEPSL